MRFKEVLTKLKVPRENLILKHRVYTCRSERRSIDGFYAHGPRFPTISTSNTFVAFSTTFLIAFSSYKAYKHLSFSGTLISLVSKLTRPHANFSSTDFYY